MILENSNFEEDLMNGTENDYYFHFNPTNASKHGCFGEGIN